MAAKKAHAHEVMQVVKANCHSGGFASVNVLLEGGPYGCDRLQRAHRILRHIGQRHVLCEPRRMDDPGRRTSGHSVAHRAEPQVRSRRIRAAGDDQAVGNRLHSRDGSTRGLFILFLSAESRSQTSSLVGNTIMSWSKSRRARTNRPVRRGW